MAPDVPPTPSRRSAARERLLAAATTLFYTEGINSVGVGRIVAEGDVTLATFYRHFPGKQDLVVAYLQGVHAEIAERLDEVAAATSGRDLILALGDDVAADMGRPGFRGCAFMNAAAEFEDPTDPVRVAVADHRRWYHETVRRAFAAAGHGYPGNAARHFVMLRDGAMAAGYLDSAVTARRTLSRGVRGLVQSIGVEASHPSDDG